MPLHGAGRRGGGEQGRAPHTRRNLQGPQQHPLHPARQGGRTIWGSSSPRGRQRGWGWGEWRCHSQEANAINRPLRPAQLSGPGRPDLSDRGRVGPSFKDPPFRDRTASFNPAGPPATGLWEQRCSLAGSSGRRWGPGPRGRPPTPPGTSSHVSEGRQALQTCWAARSREQAVPGQSQSGLFVSAEISQFLQKWGFAERSP